MNTTAGRVCRAAVLVGSLVVVARILKHVTATSGGPAALPPITGDTWPPVPVKTVR